MKPDQAYMTTVIMSACVILAVPYDLPDYLPPMLTSFLRHATSTEYSQLQNIVRQTVQSFKRTHQDRWEEFQLRFSREQLDDLQGMGAAHYYA